MYLIFRVKSTPYATSLFCRNSKNIILLLWKYLSLYSWFYGPSCIRLSLHCKMYFTHLCCCIHTTHRMSFQSILFLLWIALLLHTVHAVQWDSSLLQRVHFRFFVSSVLLTQRLRKFDTYLRSLGPSNKIRNIDAGNMYFSCSIYI